jgi:hypothetical protein
MTLPATATATCPACGADFAVEVFASVNVSVTPELKQRVLDGSLFDYDCPKCGRLSRFGHVLLYHDMERAFQVWLRPEGDAPEPILTTMFEGGPVGGGYCFRWVEQGYELAEKVRVFDARLDDRLVELLKVWTLAKSQQLGTPLLFSRRSPDGIEFLTQNDDVVPVSFSRYEALREQFAAKLDPDRGWQKIGRAFALGFLGLGPSVAEKTSTDKTSPSVELVLERGRLYDDRVKRAEHDELVRGIAIFAVVTGILGWICHGKAVGLAVLGSWLLMALLFALFPPRPVSRSD